jgi:hypothetical protein
VLEKEEGVPGLSPGGPNYKRSGGRARQQSISNEVNENRKHFISL